MQCVAHSYRWTGQLRILLTPEASIDHFGSSYFRKKYATVYAISSVIKSSFVCAKVVGLSRAQKFMRLLFDQIITGLKSKAENRNVCFSGWHTDWLVFEGLQCISPFFFVQTLLQKVYPGSGVRYCIFQYQACIGLSIMWGVVCSTPVPTFSGNDKQKILPPK